MLSFAKRRLINLTFAITIVVAASVLVYWRSNDLKASSFHTGYALFALVLFLMLYNLRKRLPSLPLGSSSTWLQLHIYGGLVSIAFFLLHVGVRFPTGILETTLYALFVTVVGSGLYGLYITRTIPKKITKLREQVVWERIPALRIAVQRQAHQVVVSLLRQSPAPTIADYYKKRLLTYFGLPRGVWYYLLPTSKLRNHILSEMTDMERFYSPDETETDQRLRRLVDQRDDLDYQDALQRRLKFWLFVHVSLTYGLLILATFHTIMAHAFIGGAR